MKTCLIHNYNKEGTEIKIKCCSKKKERIKGLFTQTPQSVNLISMAGFLQTTNTFSELTKLSICTASVSVY